MDENSQKILIDKDLRPAYYDDFHCLAESCRVSCCKGWHITFNKKDYLSLKRQNGSPALNKQISGALRRVRNANKPELAYAEFVMGYDTCPLQQENGLCLLQIEKGPQALPTVCQIFPRFQAYSVSGYLERTLTPACEGVLSLLWDLPDGVAFRSDPITDKLEIKLFAYHDKEQWNSHFQQLRSWCIDMLQNRKYPLPERIMRMGIALQKLPDYGENISDWLNTVCSAVWTQEGMYMDDTKRDQLLPLFLSNNIRLLLTSNDDMDLRFIQLQKELAEAFQITLKTGDINGLVISSTPWRIAKKRFEENFSSHDYFMENVMTGLFFHLHMPEPTFNDKMWKSFVCFCNLYSFYRFMAVMSCRDGGPADRDGLFEAIVLASRILLHNNARRTSLQDEFFRNQSTSLAHMAVLLSN